MSTRYLLLVTFFFVALHVFGQPQQGYVKTIGKPGKKGMALSGVTIRAKGEHNAAVSREDGRFSLMLKEKKDGESYSLQQVQKNGFELNDLGTIGRQYAYSSSVPITIVMVSTTQLQADIQRIENNAYKKAEKNYKDKITLLEKQRNRNAITAEQYRDSIQKLQDNFEKYQSLIESLAEHYAHTDYDELDEKDIEINILIENGNLEKADSLINTLFNPLELIKHHKESLTRLDRTISDAQSIIERANADFEAVLKQQEKDAEYLYQLYTIALAQFENDRAAQYIQTRAELDTTNVEWQRDAGRFLLEYMANFSLAMKYYMRGLRQSQLQYEGDGPWTALLENDIGAIIDQTGEYNKALECYHNALNLSIKYFGKEHPNTATSYNNIGEVYVILGCNHKALEYFFKSLETFTQFYGEDHPIISLSYCNIGLVYYNMGNYNKALDYYFKALELDEQALGKQHPYVANSYNNIGMAYYNQEEYDTALNYLFKALAIQEKALGKEHPSIATTYNNIGMSYSKQGYFDMAQEYYFKALSILEHVLGKGHPSTASLYNNIGFFYCDKGINDKALEYYFKALYIFESELGEEHSSTASTYYNIGFVYLNQDDYKNALQYCTKAYNIFKKVLGPEHPSTQKAKSSIDYLKDELNQ